MTFQPVPIAPFEELAGDIPGFSSDESQLNNSLRTTIFIAGASALSQGRASYILGNEGERQWLPNTLTCWINDLIIVTKNYEKYDPVEKMLVPVTSINGKTWCYRMGFDSWSASSLLTCIKQMSNSQLAERVQINLSPKGRATFVGISCITEDQSSYAKVKIPQVDLGRKLGYTEMLDVISHFRLAQKADETDPKEASDGSPEASDSNLYIFPPAIESEPLEPLSKPKKVRR
tara:strand:- start:1785 stop:2480 length:696 start_codon:yes stop_codon:yes gene_type:complete